MTLEELREALGHASLRETEGYSPNISTFCREHTITRGPSALAAEWVERTRPAEANASPTRST